MFTGRRVLVIMNPSSGRARPEVAEAAIASALEVAGADAVIKLTHGADDPTAWAASAHREGFDFVLAAGGDGTVTAVATGVLSSGADVPIGIVPLGTGNGLARVLRLPMDPGRAIAAMASGRVVPLDVVRVDAPRCIALFFLGAGLDAEINRDADAASKARFGFLAYLGATARNLLGRRNHRVELTVDGRSETISAHTVTVFNAGQLEFAGIEVGPAVDPHDGELDLTVMRSPGFWPSLGAVLRLASGQPHAAASRRGRHFRIDAQPPLLVHVDGDVVGTTPLEGEALPGALAFIAAAEYPADRRHAAAAVERHAAPAAP